MTNNMASLVRRLSDFLTEGNWNKGEFFSIDANNNVCACVHAAVQLLVNPAFIHGLKIHNEHLH